MLRDIGGIRIEMAINLDMNDSSFPLLRYAFSDSTGSSVGFPTPRLLVDFDPALNQITLQ